MRRTASPPSSPPPGPRRKPPRRKARRKPFAWKLRLALAAAAAVLAILAWAAIARGLAPAGNTALTRFDAIVVLGNPADADGNPTPTQLARVTEAVREYQRGVAPRLILSGASAHNRFVEAEVMARSAEAQGIPASAIVLETQSEDTIQNACYSVRIMKAQGWQSAEVVSSTSHLERAGLIFSSLPVEWRTHAAPPIEPESAATQMALASVEVLKTARYLTWARWREQCEP
ncbi:MAG: YdcF family protein [Terracidiphilus sp.]|nr:YdcF family protein [Terracidiphilus sp.]